MNRFVLLCHHTAKDQFHWDFLFEGPNACKTFSVTQKLAEKAQRTGTLECTVTPLTDHRLAYLDYEGPVSDNRGFVERLDFGTCQTIGKTIHYQGQLCSGTINLRDDFSVMKFFMTQAVNDG